MNTLHNSLEVNNNKINKFERGFKSWSENTSSSIRTRLGLTKVSPLSPFDLAKYLKVYLIEPKDIMGLSTETINYLTLKNGDEWSAVTLQSDINVIVINPSHSERRKASTIMHELSHIIRQHTPSNVYINDTGVTFRSFNTFQEAEADWLAGTLLLPRDALIHCRYNKYSNEEACKIYGVSTSLFTYRMNISGVNRQFIKLRT